ncbi:MAG: enoyl-CoA hydratase/isomerase family protein, partial [Hyphomicrobiaceae bacterium]|nr:enoyl-CoA hydratase/isomerase family protein [Hyphomicrobiaceae bacterium]
MSSDIEVAIVDGVQTIRFARAAKKNALTGAMYQAIAEALSAGEGDGAVAAHVFLGQPGVFTAGNDLADFVARAQSAAQSGSLALDGAVMDVLRLLPRVEKPMIAAVDGIAIGIGTTLLMHCDLVYASPEARLQTPFLDLGLVPEAGSSLIGPRIMGHQRAFEMLV